MAATIVAERVSKRFGETVALSDVSLSVDAGDVFALVGPNGAGKTTLVRTLTGTHSPSSGTVSVLGDSPTAVDHNRIGLLPQSFSPPERLTPRELLGYYAGLYDAPRDVDAVLADVGLDDDAADTWYETLSGGQQRRTCVGIALVNDPDVLFLDEPTTGIDPAGRQSLWGLVSDLAADGTTVFLTTHYMAEAETLADRVALLSDGRLVETDTPAALVEKYTDGPSLSVETTAGDAATAVVGDRGFVTEPTETGLRVTDIDPRDIGDVVAALEAQDVPYDSLTWSHPTLEDVYLRLADGAGDGASAETERGDAAASRRDVATAPEGSR